ISNAIIAIRLLATWSLHWLYEHLLVDGALQAPLPDLLVLLGRGLLRGRIRLGFGLELLPGCLVGLSDHELPISVDHDARGRLGVIAVGILAEGRGLVNGLEKRPGDARGPLDARPVVVLRVVVGGAEL